MPRWEPTDITCACGRTIEVRDWGREDETEGRGLTMPADDGSGYDPEFRFETSCDRCRDCDPNGYPTREAAVAKAAAYFGGA